MTSQKSDFKTFNNVKHIEQSIKFDFNEIIKYTVFLSVIRPIRLLITFCLHEQQKS